MNDNHGRGWGRGIKKRSLEFLKEFDGDCPSKLSHVLIFFYF